jgi:hypothetical protein
MLENVKQVLIQFDNCKLDTKIILVIILTIIFIGVYFLLKVMVKAIKAGFNFENLINNISKLGRIIRDYELKTIAGLINLTMSILLLIITIGVFLSVSISAFLGLGENITASKILLVISTIIATFVSLWVLYKFEKQTMLLKK